jgi:hypothetical protein
MSRPLKRCKFIDDAAELSGSGSGDEDAAGDEIPDEENDDDRNFIDDSSPQPEEERAVSKVFFLIDFLR